MDIRKYAIITLDIIDSRKMKADELAQFALLSEDLNKQDIIDQVEIFRGDGMQSRTAHVKDGCQAIIAQYAYFKMNLIHVRQALGVGTVQLNADRLANSAGPAFEISGRALDGLKAKDQLTKIQFESIEKNAEWDVHSAVLSELMSNWSIAQAEAVFYTMIGKTQMEIAEKLKISQAAIHQRLKSAKINLLHLFIKRYKTCL